MPLRIQSRGWAISSNYSSTMINQHTKSGSANSLPEDFDEYFLEQQEIWENSQPKFTDSELLEFFPDAIDQVLPDKAKELGDESVRLIKQIKQIHSSLKGKNLTAALLNLEILKQTKVRRLLENEKNIAFYDRLIAKRHPERFHNKREASQANLERARSVPIADLAISNLQRIRKTGKNYSALCPFHEDKQPSFILYPDSNSYYCFGCHKHGDVITFTQELFGMDFPSAIRYLTSK